MRRNLASRTVRVDPVVATRHPGAAALAIAMHSPRPFLCGSGRPQNLPTVACNGRGKAMQSYCHRIWSNMRVTSCSIACSIACAAIAKCGGMGSWGGCCDLSRLQCTPKTCGSEFSILCDQKKLPSNQQKTCVFATTAHKPQQRRRRDCWKLLVLLTAPDGAAADYTHECLVETQCF
jgi:hypothetical protein